MTSIEWLNKELEYFGDPDRCIISWKELDSLIEQAKKIGKKQLIAFHISGQCDKTEGDPMEIAEQYYNTIFESKENQKQLIVDIMEEDSKDGLYDIPLQECVNCNEQKQVHSICLDCCIKLGNQNQTEISDEEIEKIINPNKLEKIPESWKSFIDGAKWYREQLKQKQ